MSDTPLVPGEATALAETVAGLRAANARLRELIAERDELIAELRVQVAEAGELREQVEQLRREVADFRPGGAKFEELLEAALRRTGWARPRRSRSERRPPRARPPEGQGQGATMSLTGRSRSHDPGTSRLYEQLQRHLAKGGWPGCEQRQVAEIPPVKSEGSPGAR